MSHLGRNWKYPLSSLGGILMTDYQQDEVTNGMIGLLLWNGFQLNESLDWTIISLVLYSYDFAWPIFKKNIIWEYASVI